MTVAEFVPLVWLKFRGKGADKAPAAGTPKWNNIVALANLKLREKWATDPRQNWDSLFREDETSLSKVIDLEDDVAKVVDSVILKNGTQQKTVRCVDAKDRNKWSDVCYKSGINPATLTFTSDIPAEFVGGTVTVPVNYKPEPLSSNTDVIPCDNPYWLVLDVAADLAFKKPHYSDLVAEAQREYDKMCNANGSTFDSASHIIENGYGDYF